MIALPPHAESLLLASMTFMDRLYDDQAGLLWAPGEGGSPWPNPGERHMVRDSVYYALGLLMRDALGDRPRAERILSAVLDLQLLHPEAPFHGTFLRAPEEPRPGLWAREWRDYDPNWRDFIGCTFALIQLHFGLQLPREMEMRMDEALRQMVLGTLARRVNPGYTNIALMDAYLLHYAGSRLDAPSWQREGEALARRVYALYQAHQSFEEFNSPTYYGTDLFALALWRSFSRSDVLRQYGAEMEAGLWQDIARFYHASLRNACGPFDRSYGMDMTRYCALEGEWIWLSTGQKEAPFPDPARPFDHAADMTFGPPVALCGAVIPEEAQAHLAKFQGERLVERVISGQPKRVATAWLAERAMMGGECTGRTKSGGGQFHPFTLHWRATSGEIGWARLIHDEPVDAVVSRGQARIEGAHRLMFRMHSPAGAAPEFEAGAWRMEGLQVAVETNNTAFSVNEVGDGLYELLYESAGDIEIALKL